jgi:hypothetical protein
MKSEILEVIDKLDIEKKLTPYITDNFERFKNGAWLDGEYEPLSDEWLRENRVLAGIEDAAEQELLTTAKQVRTNETLNFLFYHCAELLFGINQLYDSSQLKQWPTFDSFLSKGKTSQFNLLLGLHAIDKIVAIHKSKNIPRDITVATCSDVGSRVLISKQFDDGKIGISTNCLNWLRNHVAGRLFQIGRLQFHIIQFSKPFRVYRHIKKPDYKIVAEPGLRFNEKGFFDGAGFKLSPNGWNSELTQNGKEITANTVDGALGMVKQKKETFSLDEWIQVLNNDSYVLNTHIPRGPKITTKSWFDSISRSFDFFENQLTPGIKVDAAVCSSWMLEPTLREILPESSGLVTLQNAVRKFPWNTTSTTCGLYFIFGDADIDINSAPTDNTLRKGIVDHIKNGGILTGGCMIHFRDERS